MIKKYKYKYWHKILSISNEYQKKNPDIKVGMGIGRTDKFPYAVDLVDLETGEEYNSAYLLEYVGRLPFNAPPSKVKELFDNFNSKPTK